MFVPGLQRSSRTAETSPSTITYGTAIFGLFLETMRVLDAEATILFRVAVDDQHGRKTTARRLQLQSSAR